MEEYGPLLLRQLVPLVNFKLQTELSSLDRYAEQMCHYGNYERYMLAEEAVLAPKGADPDFDVIRSVDFYHPGQAGHGAYAVRLCGGQVWPNKMRGGDVPAGEQKADETAESQLLLQVCPVRQKRRGILQTGAVKNNCRFRREFTSRRTVSVYALSAGNGRNHIIYPK